MEKLTKVKMTLLDDTVVEFEEMLDVGAYYYVASGDKIRDIRKDSIKEIQYLKKEHTNDSSKYH